MAGLSRDGKRAHPKATPAERILLHTDRSGDCWIWTGSHDPGGYGHLRIGDRLISSHRVSYEAFVGPIPDGLHLDHLCRVRLCCKPSHLEPVTQYVNMLRSPIHHRVATHCPYGHAYTPGNTKITSAGGRACRTCAHAYAHLYNAMTPQERAARKAAGLRMVDLAGYFASRIAEAA